MRVMGLIDKRCMESWLNKQVHQIVGSLQGQLVVLDGKALRTKKKLIDSSQWPEAPLAPKVPVASAPAQVSKELSALRNFEEAKRAAAIIFKEHRFNFYCQCRFNEAGIVEPDTCSYKPNWFNSRTFRIECELLYLLNF